MAGTERSVRLAPVRSTLSLRYLFRLAVWGMSAGCALFIALYAATTEIGRARLHLAFADVHEPLMPANAKSLRALDAREGRQLADIVRSLDVDRGQLLARVAMLEQRVVDITGFILRVETAAQPASPTYSTAPVEPMPPTSAPDEDVTSNIPTPPQQAQPAPPTYSTAPVAPMPPTSAPDEDVTSSIPLPPQQPPGSNSTKTEFGLDLGSATSVEALRTAWAAALRQHGALLEGLRPLVHIRERPRPARMELRLVVGPVPNAASAARLCLSMTAARAICAPTMFEGQRLQFQNVRSNRRLEPDRSAQDPPG